MLKTTNNEKRRKGKTETYERKLIYEEIKPRTNERKRKTVKHNINE